VRGQKVYRSALGQVVDFDKIIRAAGSPQKREAKTQEVRQKLKEVEQKRVNGYVPPIPAEPTPLEATMIAPKRPKGQERRREHAESKEMFE
jgi:thiamine pyrophosphate-dependent acetolactate synthase large subunit-like protein